MSVKSKTNPASSNIYVVEKCCIKDFIITNLSSDSVILIDSVETFPCTTNAGE